MRNKQKANRSTIKILGLNIYRESIRKTNNFAKVYDMRMSNKIKLKMPPKLVFDAHFGP